MIDLRIRIPNNEYPRQTRLHMRIHQNLLIVLIIQLQVHRPRQA